MNPNKLDQTLPQGRNYHQEKSEGKKSKWTNKPDKKEWSDKKEHSSPCDSASKMEGIWKLTGNKIPAIKDMLPLLMVFNNKKHSLA
jgi:hypothetical protein